MSAKGEKSAGEIAYGAFYGREGMEMCWEEEPEGVKENWEAVGAAVAGAVVKGELRVIL